MEYNDNNEEAFKAQLDALDHVKRKMVDHTLDKMAEGDAIIKNESNWRPIGQKGEYQLYRVPTTYGLDCLIGKHYFKHMFDIEALQGSSHAYRSC